MISSLLVYAINLLKPFRFLLPYTFNIIFYFTHSLIIAECLGAERSRQRSPIRSVPVAASVKREVDFDCPEEFGYYPHPTDCTLYYVCVFGGALLESCTGGLMYR